MKVHCDSVGVAAADVLDEQAAQSLQRPRNRTLARVAVPETSVVVSSPAQHVPVALSVHRRSLLRRMIIETTTATAAAAAATTTTATNTTAACFIDPNRCITRHGDPAPPVA